MNLLAILWPAENHDGILLIGDYTSLRWLHEVVHDVHERSPLVRDKEGMFLGLAYDERKAYEQQREILQPHQHYEEIGVRYGVAGVSTNTVVRFETGAELKESTIDALRSVFQDAGLEFIAENGGGAGVRFLKPARAQK